MMSLILVGKKAFEFQWFNLWIEMDSMHILNLFNLGKIPWHLGNDGLERFYFSIMRRLSSRIFIEKEIALRISCHAALSQIQSWWFNIADNLASMTYIDPVICFTTDSHH